MLNVILVFVVQAIFMFFIDHKYRFLTDNNINKLLIFQGIIATMYVFVIPMIAKGDTYTSLAYIAGSIAGTAISYKTHKKGNKSD